MDQPMQASLFDEIGSAETDRPKCRLCGGPAHWQPQLQRWSAYCTKMGCGQNIRQCKHCGKTFDRHDPGTGSKYCSAECSGARQRSYLDVVAGIAQRAVQCAWCGAAVKAPSGPRAGGWPFICGPCLEPIKHVVQRLKSHHVDHQLAHRLVTDPSCEICGTDLLARTRDKDSGKVVSQLVVDHDHTCCPQRSTSCGRCVRGLICKSCNVAIGFVRDDPVIAKALVIYLERFSGSPSAIEGGPPNF